MTIDLAAIERRAMDGDVDLHDMLTLIAWVRELDAEVNRLSIQPVPYWCDLCDRRFPHAPKRKP